MNFFDRYPPPVVPEPDPTPPRRIRWMRPEATLGASVAGEFVLARSAEAAVTVGGLTVYPNGFTFSVTAFLRQEDLRRHSYHLAFHRDFHDDEPPGPEFLRLGVLFADGTAASNLGGHGDFLPDADPTGPLMVPHGGGGGGQRYEMSHWVWPLPPPGPLTFVCAWPARGIDESRAELDAGLIRDAAARAVPFWSDDQQ